MHVRERLRAKMDEQGADDNRSETRMVDHKDRSNDRPGIFEDSVRRIDRLEALYGLR